MSGSDWRKQTKARKTHQCEICRNQILPGEVYIRYDCTPWGHPDNEGYHTYRNCRFCDHMHYDVLQIADEDGAPWWEMTFCRLPTRTERPGGKVALDLLRDRGISLNSPGRVRQVLGWFGDTDNVRRAIETVRGEQA